VVLPVAIIGSGNIGTDLMYKLERSSSLDLVALIGIDPQSDGLSRARSLGKEAPSNGIDWIKENPDAVRLVFDATSAYVHVEHAKVLAELGITAVDLTPACRGPKVIPPVNLGMHLERPNVNMVTCGGQATIPMVYAVSRVQPLDYAEIIATVSSRSAGPGTRKNIDEFTRTTSAAVAEVGGAKRGKAIIVINPAEPPLIMRDTVHCLTEGEPDQARITESIHAMVAEVQRYVPGYRLVNGPVFDGHRVSVYLEVAGLGDYLPRYAGNLDIMTAAAARTAEMFAEQLLGGQPTLAAAERETA